MARPEKKSSKANRVSMQPANAEAGTGLLNDIDVQVMTAEWALWDYNGKQEESPALHLGVIPLDADDDAETTDIWLSAGSINRMVPSDDGDFLDRAEGSTAKGLNTNCNAYLFLESLEAAGFPTKRLDTEGVGLLVGLRFHLLRVPQPKRPGLQIADAEDGGGRARVAMYVSVSEIIKLPWEKLKKGEKTAAKKSKASKSAKGAATSKRAAKDEDEDEEDDEDEDADDDSDDDDEDDEPAPKKKGRPKGSKNKKSAKDEDDEDDEEEDADEDEDEDDEDDEDADPTAQAVEIVNELLASKPYAKGLPKASLYTAVFAAAKKLPNKKEIMAAVQEDDFLDAFTVSKKGLITAAEDE